MTRVFLVEDHELVRAGIAQVINAEPDLDVVGEAACFRGTVRKLIAAEPDVAVLDVYLPDGNGIDLCRSIRSARPGIRCLMLTAYDEDSASLAAVLAGASGYVIKNVRAGNLVDGIRRAALGESLLPRGIVHRVQATLLDPAPGPRTVPFDLTLREQQALQLITEGLTNRQIGEHLGLAEKTVKNYVSGLLAKLGMERRTQVAAYGARREGPGKRQPSRNA
ncbi:MAG TPA: response regulator transcription factor [Propionicimonas sp.]|jgi:DNA-binding NarL/FixJ family response regulator